MSEPAPIQTPAAEIVPAYGGPPSPPPLGRRPYAWGELVSWTAVLLLIALVAGFIAYQQWQGKGGARPETQLTMSAKYALGVHKLLPVSPGSQLLSELDNTVTTPESRFRLAILSRELVGEEEAAKRLQAIAEEEPSLAEDVVIVGGLYKGSEPDAERLQTFQKKWGWFGDLAASVDKPSSDPLRRSVLNSAYGVAITLLTVVMGGIGAVFLGLTLLIVALVQLFRGKLLLRYGMTDPQKPALVLPRDRRAYIEGFALFVWLYFGTSILLTITDLLPALVRSAVAMVVMLAAVLIGLFWPKIRGGTWAEWRAACGLHTGRGIIREGVAGVIGYIAGLPIVALGLTVTLILIKLSDVQPSHPINNVIESGGPLFILIVFLAAAVWAPISEELIFRGLLYSHMRERYRPIFSAAVGGFLFAIVHPQGWAVVPVLASIGFVFALIREWRGSIIPCMVAHSLHNGGTVLLAILIMR